MAAGEGDRFLDGLRCFSGLPKHTTNKLDTTDIHDSTPKDSPPPTFISSNVEVEYEEVEDLF